MNINILCIQTLSLFLILGTCAAAIAPCCTEGLSLASFNDTYYVCGSNQTNKIEAFLLVCDPEAELYPLELNLAKLTKHCSVRNGEDTVYFGCGTDDPVTPTERALEYCRLVSVTFYFLTAIIYILLPKMRDLFGKCIISYCVSIGVGLSIYTSISLEPHTKWEIIQGYCAAKGFLAMFFIVSCFFWCSAIALIMLRTLTVSPFHSSDRSWKIFLRYGIYAWGVPAIWIIILIIIQYTPGDHIKPYIGLTLDDTCWPSGWKQMWIFFYSILSVVLVVNCMIFGSVSYIIWKSPRCRPSMIKNFKYKCSIFIPN